jgi:hypothetical protein
MLSFSVPVEGISYTTFMRFTRTHLLLISAALIPACAVPGDAPWSDLHASVYAVGFTPTLEVASSTIAVPANGSVGALNGSFSVDAEKEYTRQYGARIGFAPFELSISQFNHSRNQNGVISGDGGVFLGEPLVGDLAVDSSFDIDATKIMLGIDMLNTSVARVGLLVGLDVFSFNQFRFTAQEANGLNIQPGAFQNVLVDQEVPVPIIGIRGDIAIPGTTIRLGAEISGVSIDIDDINASFFDHDVNLNMQIFESGEAVIGYRAVQLNIDGQIDTTTINMDLSMSGPYFGVSFYF